MQTGQGARVDNQNELFSSTAQSAAETIKWDTKPPLCDFHGRYSFFYGESDDYFDLTSAMDYVELIQSDTTLESKVGIRFTTLLSIQKIYEYIDRGVFLFDQEIITYPWNNTAVQVFVDSILRNYEIPQLTANYTTVFSEFKIGWDKIIIFDGRQRLCALDNFRRGLFGLKYSKGSCLYAVEGIKDGVQMPKKLWETFLKREISISSYYQLSQEQVFEILFRIEPKKCPSFQTQLKYFNRQGSGNLTAPIHSLLAYFNDFPRCLKVKPTNKFLAEYWAKFDVNNPNFYFPPSVIRQTWRVLLIFSKLALKSERLRLILNITAWDENLIRVFIGISLVIRIVMNDFSMTRLFGFLENLTKGQLITASWSQWYNCFVTLQRYASGRKRQKMPNSRTSTSGEQLLDPLDESFSVSSASQPSSASVHSPHIARYLIYNNGSSVLQNSIPVHWNPVQPRSSMYAPNQVSVTDSAQSNDQEFFNNNVDLLLGVAPFRTGISPQVPAVENTNLRPNMPQIILNDGNIVKGSTELPEIVNVSPTLEQEKTVPDADRSISRSATILQQSEPVNVAVDFTFALAKELQHKPTALEEEVPGSEPITIALSQHEEQLQQPTVTHPLPEVTAGKAGIDHLKAVEPVAKDESSDISVLCAVDYKNETSAVPLHNKTETQRVESFLVRSGRVVKKRKRSSILIDLMDGKLPSSPSSLIEPYGDLQPTPPIDHSNTIPLKLVDEKENLNQTESSDTIPITTLDSSKLENISEQVISDKGRSGSSVAESTRSDLKLDQSQAGTINSGPTVIESKRLDPRSERVKFDMTRSQKISPLEKQARYFELSNRPYFGPFYIK
ncbi:hypothetical protein V1514DRAFT_319961 [Lipomyces japonicus]|uniref:uncharacterized protein n=1 Tax=Lipomyces japonicus TaxID=56871 RepID=UPI0034CEF421